MLILQYSDLHTEADRGLAYGVADTAHMVEQAIAHVGTLKQKPDCLVITGDLASSGNPKAYSFVQRALADLDLPIYLLPGNHDHRKTLLEYLGRWCPAEAAVAPYLCYTVDDGPVRLIMLDTTRPGSHSGHLDMPVLAWLLRTLRQKPKKPTLLFMHHPPFASGMGMMDEAFENAPLLANLLQDYPYVRLCCGHLHRALTTVWANRVCLGAPSVAMQMEMNLSAQGGDAFVMEAPGYLLHQWNKATDAKEASEASEGSDSNEGQLVHHFCQIPGQPSYSGPHTFAGVINPI